MNINENELDTCQQIHFHKDSIDAAVSIMPLEKDVLLLSEIFKVLADSTRLKIILALMESELCVCDISCVVGLSQSAVSHQLRVLRSARLAKYRKDGKMVYYSIDDDHVMGIIKQALEHANHIH